MYVIVTNHVNWHRENLRSDREFENQFEWVPCCARIGLNQDEHCYSEDSSMYLPYTDFSNGKNDYPISRCIHVSHFSLPSCSCFHMVMSHGLTYCSMKL